MEPTKTDQSSRNMIIWIVVVVVILIIGTYLIARNRGGNQSAVSPSPTETPLSEGPDSVAVSAQFPGNTLYLDSVTFANGGWAVVHESANGQPGKIIGEKYFPAGTNPGSIDLGSAMVAGNEYIVMLHSDDGDKKFDATKDLPLKDAQGNIIMKIIKASKTPEQVKG